jgi:PTH1 family peptidyl-tRNA hydrolase
MKLIVGLGNPGPQYHWTRHNLGFLALEALGKKKPSGVLLLKPTTFMNDSGTAVKKAVAKSGIEPQNILVICDDLSLPFGKIRIRPSGSDGGHNGLKSIINELGSKQFARLRMGIGEPEGTDTVDYVLGNFTPAQKKALAGFINHALDCVTCWVTEGAQAAMNKFNSTTREK